RLKSERLALTAAAPSSGGDSKLSIGWLSSTGMQQASYNCRSTSGTLTSRSISECLGSLLSRVAMSGCCRLASTSDVQRFCLDSAAARFTATVVAPTPPLAPSTATTDDASLGGGAV